MNHRPRRQAALNTERAFAANRDNDNELDERLQEIRERNMLNRESQQEATARDVELNNWRRDNIRAVNESFREARNTRTRQREETKEAQHEAQVNYHNIARKYLSYEFLEDEFMELNEEGIKVMKKEHRSYLGEMSERCSKCGARYWKEEMTISGTFNNCCENGRIKLPVRGHRRGIYSKCSDTRYREGSVFMKNPISIQNQIGFSSINAQRDRMEGWDPGYSIMGQVYSYLGPAFTNQSPAFMSNYFYTGDPSDTLYGEFSDNEKNIIATLRDDLMNNNPYLEAIQSHAERYPDASSLPQFSLEFSDIPTQLSDPNTHRKVYARPSHSATELGLILNDNYGTPSHRSIMCKPQ